MVLAPMYDVTDVAFRQMFARYGKPGVLVTEFASAAGLAHPLGSTKLAHLLAYDENERPIVAQLFGADPAAMRAAAALVARAGFDGIDINMGCPEKNVQKQGAGAALIRTPDLAVAIVDAARAGVADASCDIPVSVKTRIGYNHEEIDTWIAAILAARPAALTVHLRTKKEMSDVPAHWDLMPRVVALRDAISPTTVLIGNGDVASVAEADEKAARYGCDGVMVGRGAFGNPWFFDRAAGGVPPSVGAHLAALAEHIRLFDARLSTYKNFDVMKRHFKAYVHGWDGAHALRAALMDTHTAAAALAVLAPILEKWTIDKKHGIE